MPLDFAGTIDTLQNMRQSAPHPKSHVGMINAWPSLADFADDIGVSYGTAKAMRRRGSVPPEYWVSMVSNASERGIGGVTFATLAAAVAKLPEVAQ